MILDFFQEASEKAFKDKLIKFGLVFSLLVNILLWIFLAWQSQKLSAVIPLHYNIYYGIDFFGPWYYLFLFPGLGLGILALNFLLALMTYANYKILSYFLMASLVAMQIFLFLSLAAVLTINI
ncbi:MAG: hypothetical protein HUU49_00950 [Candidatus Buchananbacteria bacterium]|nr:hypothetical protein [Candidatus Buchananbacteria bacterium]